MFSSDGLVTVVIFGSQINGKRFPSVILFTENYVFVAIVDHRECWVVLHHVVFY